MNYNFALHWEERITPLLKTPRIQKALRKGITAWLNSEKNRIIENYELTEEEKLIKGKARTALFKVKRKQCETTRPHLKYNRDKLPIYYARGDSCCMFNDDIEEKLVPKLIEWGILKEDVNKPQRAAFDDEESYSWACDDYFNDWGENIQKYEAYKNTVIEPYEKAFQEKHYQSYCVYGACHWYNSTFCLELAKMLMPDEQWHVKSSAIHTTVVNATEDKVFDILYYENDETFGGRTALNATNNYISWEEHDEIQSKLYNKQLTEQQKVELIYRRDQMYNSKYIS